MNFTGKENAISVFGMGRLGVCLAALLASRGKAVIGVDIDGELVQRINAGRTPNDEPGLGELFAAGGFRATIHGEEAVAASGISVIFVATPGDADGVMSSAHVRAVAECIGRGIASKKEHHLVILCSTVLPGVSESEIIPAIEEHSGKRCGEGFGFCYLPEFVATGSVIRDMLEPEMVVVGERDGSTWPAIRTFCAGYLRNEPPFRRMNIVNAELAKIAINTFVCAKISQANILAGLCERIPGADVDIVTQAVGSDSRVGRKAFTGGLGYGGPCYPKDVRSFAALLEGMGLPASFFEAVHAGNESAGAHLADCVLQLADELHAGAVGLFGVAFKPGSSSVANSSGVALAKRLLGQSRRVILHDPLALDAAREIFGGRLRYVRDVRECFDACGVAVFVNADPCYRALTRDWFESHPGPLAVVDCWRMYRFLENAKSIRYRPIGLYQAPRETPAELENRKVHSQ